MRQILIVAAVILSTAAPAMVTSTAVVTAMSLVTAEQAQDTAVLPGWQQSCGRNPRCFERGEARRRARGLYLRYR